MIMLMATLPCAVCISNDTASCSAQGGAAVPLPLPMPASIAALIREAWSELDADGEEMVDVLSRGKLVSPLSFFAHARSTFKEHLIGTFGLLAAWGQPKDVRRAGLFHTAYSGDLFQFYVFDASSSADRSELRGIIGTEAESLVHMFGTVHRGQLVGLSDAINDTAGAAPPAMSGAPDDATLVADRLLGERRVSNREASKLMVVTIADYLEQMVEVNGWRDHHQVEMPEALYPGDGKPALALHWMSHVCLAVRGQLEVVPPIFDGCTRLISLDDERAARDAYWRVVQREADLSEAEQLALLDEAAAKNPFVGEVHLMAAQLHFRAGRHALAAEACARALERFYALATAWDKRRSFGSWVGYARVLYLRATRLSRGLSSLPYNEELPPTSGGLKMVGIRGLVDDLP